MKIMVAYRSRTGNTKKVAEAIAAAVGVAPEIISGDFTITEPIDLLLVGDGVYFGSMSASARRFIAGLDAKLVGRAAVFGTFGGQDKGIRQTVDLLRKQGIRTLDETFGCKGKAWLFLNRKHPSAEELRHAGEFARRAVASLSEK